MTANTDQLVTYHNPTFHDLSGKDMLFSRDFTPAEFKDRRRRIQKEIGPEAHLFLPSGPPNPSIYNYVDAKFYYTCGLDLQHAYLLMDGADGHTTVFLPTRDAIDAGPADRLGFEDADYICSKLDLDAVRPLDDLADALKAIKSIFIPFVEIEGGGAGRFQGKRCATMREEAILDEAEPDRARMMRLLTERIPGVDLQDATAIFDTMRTIKSTAEIELMREAGRLNALVMIESMKATRPGLTETRLQAIADFIFRDQGHSGPGYHTIVSADVNSMDGHYHRNNTSLKAGQMILMDCGPDLRHYTSDIARCWPVSGTFSEPFGNVYGMIAEYHKVLLKLTKPGAMIGDIYTEAAEIMRHTIKQPSFPYGDMSPFVEQMIEKNVNYLNHSVGMSVHDPAPAYREKPLEEGFVCAVDPMIWHNDVQLYIRVEDTIVVTADGCERLTGAAPFEIETIEALMKEPSNFTL